MSRTIRNKNNMPTWIYKETRFVDNVAKGYSNGGRYKWSPYRAYDVEKELKNLNYCIACFSRDNRFPLKQSKSNTYFNGNQWDRNGKSISAKLIDRRMWSKSNRRCAKDDIAEGLNDYDDRNDDLPIYIEVDDHVDYINNVGVINLSPPAIQTIGNVTNIFIEKWKWAI